MLRHWELILGLGNLHGKLNRKSFLHPWELLSFSIIESLAEAQ